ncbi:response regulator [Rubrobacter calidifluminis]|uniref:response regulator n=1 Tax=Rubrobacter calidifluminis TaxID=1392640 RepID=UPI002360AA8D|nr:response regulator [Rubrobacter calidifluminis]
MNTHTKPPGGATGTRCVLLVHENELFREALALLLQWKTSFGHSLHASCLAEARSLLQEVGEVPDLVVLDLDTLPPEDRGEPGKKLDWLSGIPLVGLTTGEIPAPGKTGDGCVILNASGRIEEMVSAFMKIAEGG